jgi:hypothetical protein
VCKGFNGTSAHAGRMMNNAYAGRVSLSPLPPPPQHFARFELCEGSRTAVQVFVTNALSRPDDAVHNYATRRYQ